MSHNVLIVEARFYEDIADELVAGATAAFDAVGVTYERVTVAGALEIPAAIAFAQGSDLKRPPFYAGYLALGCVIRGETSHYDIVAGESARGLMDLAITEKVALANGILTVDTRDQAMARANRTQGNKGGFSADALLTQMRLKQRFGVPR